MRKEPTTLGPEDLKGHRFSAFWLDLSRGPPRLFSLSGQTEAMSSPKMTSSSAPTPVGETPLIQELNSDGTCATPELYTRPSLSPPLESESAPLELPTVMADLQHAGHHFQTVSCELWKVSGPKVRIKKDCSVCFSVDTVVTSQDIVAGFDKS